MEVPTKKETIKIELKEVKPKGSDSPVILQSKNPPMSNKFKFVPKQMPQLVSCVDLVKWNSTSNQLVVHMRETPDFGVYKWLKYLKQIWAEAQQGPFVSMSDALHLTFCDAQDQPLATFVFGSINVEDHKCTLVRNALNMELSHVIVLGYKMVEMLQSTDEMPKATNELVDKEWQTVECD